MNTTEPFTLANTEELNELYPDTFEIPSVDERKNLQLFSFAKVIFNPTDGERPSERMWVKVVSINKSGSYIGLLDNEPVVMTELTIGDTIKFLPENIASIY